MRSITFSEAFRSSGIVLLIAFLLSLLTGLPNNIGDYGANTVLLGSLYGVGLFILLALLSRFLMPYNASLRDATHMLRQLFGEFNWSTIFLISVMAGVSEELLFRGVIQSSLVEFTSPWFGIVLSSLLFALMHFYNRMYLFVTFVVSLMIGYLYYVTQSLLLVMVLHSVYDVLAFASIIKYPHLIGLESQ